MVVPMVSPNSRYCKWHTLSYPMQLSF